APPGPPAPIGRMNRWLAALFVALMATASLCARPTMAAGPTDTAQRAALTRALTIVDVAIGARRDIQMQAARSALVVLNADPDLAKETWLTGPLQGRSPNLVQARNRLEAALAALDPPPTSAGDAAANRKALATVLADPRFHPRDLTSYLPGWLVPVAV